MKGGPMAFLPKGPYLEFERPIAELAQRIEELMKTENVTPDDVKNLVSRKEKLQKKIFSKLTSWQRVELARRAGRPYTMDYIENCFTDFVELHGDRCYADDQAIVAGMAKLDGNSVMVIGHQKGHDTRESIKRNFGMAHPEGYRKAARMLRMAEKFNLPVICFIDTPGAYPGIGAEERGQAAAIAENLKLMSTLSVPILCVVIGEGASGGALGIGVGDRLLMMENAWYCVISPEGCAAILWGDNSKKQEVAKAMKLTAGDLVDIHIVDRIIPEPLGGAHWNPQEQYEIVKPILVEEIQMLMRLTAEELVDNRIAKLAAIGSYA